MSRVPKCDRCGNVDIEIWEKVTTGRDSEWELCEDCAAKLGKCLEGRDYTQLRDNLAKWLDDIEKHGELTDITLKPRKNEILVEYRNNGKIGRGIPEEAMKTVEMKYAGKHPHKIENCWNEYSIADSKLSPLKKNFFGDAELAKGALDKQVEMGARNY